MATAPVRDFVDCISDEDNTRDGLYQRLVARLTAGWPDELRQRLIAITPLARFGDADEVAGAAVFLASDEASFITGQTVNINGGAFMN